MPHDVAYRELKVGDRVAATYVGYPDLRVGIVTRFTPKKIVVGYSGMTNDGSLYEEHKFFSQVCLISQGNQNGN